MVCILLHRANPPAETHEVYYKQSLMIPLLGHITSQMQTRFGETHKDNTNLLALTPSIAALPDCYPDSIKELIQTYSAYFHQHHYKLLTIEDRKKMGGYF